MIAAFRHQLARDGLRGDWPPPSPIRGQLPVANVPARVTPGAPPPRLQVSRYLAGASLIDRRFSGCQPTAMALTLRVVLPGLAKSITPIATLWNFP